MHNETLKYIADEIKIRKEDFKDKLYLIIDNKHYKNLNRLQLVAYDLIFAAKDIMQKCKDIFPETHALLLQKDEVWKASEKCFEHNVWKQKHKYSFHDKGNNYCDSFEIVEILNNYLTEKNWAEEIAWRIERAHQLRLVEDKNSKSKKYLDEVIKLLPQSINNDEIEKNINQIAAMAFPSILESIVHGIKDNQAEIKSTISDGFYEDDLELRRQILKYQHRMHPEISKFPRERFYKKENALRDLEKPKSIGEMREWKYKCYSKRAIWIDVDGETKRNYNEKEVDYMIKHLNMFREFAIQNPKSNGEKWTVACLTFYRGQETKIREKLRTLTKKETAFSEFNIYDEKININLHTVDKFQGHEADIVFLSMVQTKRDGFLDNPNRLNVAITRAKYQLVVIGKFNYFAYHSMSEDLREFAKETIKYENKTK